MTNPDPFTSNTAFEDVMSEIVETRVKHVPTLYSGSHYKNDELRMCAMEAVAYVAGEAWSDHPKCACPVIGAFMRSWNDALPSNTERDRLLLPLIPKLVGSKSTSAIEARRAIMAADWFVRTHTVAWLRLAKLDKHADALASMPEIVSFSKCPPLLPALEAARRDANAAWSAAEIAAESAAESAAWSAARSAARSAAEIAARSAARSAAWSAARSAAEIAAESAAESALASTTAELQLSAVDLVERMCAVKDEVASSALPFE